MNRSNFALVFNLTILFVYEQGKAEDKPARDQPKSHFLEATFKHQAKEFEQAVLASELDAEPFLYNIKRALRKTLALECIARRSGEFLGSNMTLHLHAAESDKGPEEISMTENPKGRKVESIPQQISIFPIAPLMLMKSKVTRGFQLLLADEPVGIGSIKIVVSQTTNDELLWKIIRFIGDKPEVESFCKSKAIINPFHAREDSENSLEFEDDYSSTSKYDQESDTAKVTIRNSQNTALAVRKFIFSRESAFRVNIKAVTRNEFQMWNLYLMSNFEYLFQRELEMGNHEKSQAIFKLVFLEDGTGILSSIHESPKATSLKLDFSEANCCSPSIKLLGTVGGHPIDRKISISPSHTAHFDRTSTLRNMIIANIFPVIATLEGYAEPSLDELEGVSREISELGEWVERFGKVDTDSNVQIEECRAVIHRHFRDTQEHFNHFMKQVNQANLSSKYEERIASMHKDYNSALEKAQNTFGVSSEGWMVRLSGYLLLRKFPAVSATEAKTFLLDPLQLDEDSDDHARDFDGGNFYRIGDRIVTPALESGKIIGVHENGKVFVRVGKSNRLRNFEFNKIFAAFGCSHGVCVHDLVYSERGGSETGGIVIGINPFDQTVAILSSEYNSSHQEKITEVFHADCVDGVCTGDEVINSNNFPGEVLAGNIYNRKVAFRKSSSRSRSIYDGMANDFVITKKNIKFTNSQRKASFAQATLLHDDFDFSMDEKK